MNSTAATFIIRECLRRRLLPHHEVWRCQGQYADGNLRDGCDVLITSEQASYEVERSPGVTPQSVNLHRACFEIWQYEGESPPTS